MYFELVNSVGGLVAFAARTPTLRVLVQHATLNLADVVVVTTSVGFNVLLGILNATFSFPSRGKDYFWQRCLHSLSSNTTHRAHNKSCSGFVSATASRPHAQSCQDSVWHAWQITYENYMVVSSPSTVGARAREACREKGHAVTGRNQGQPHR